jgi:PleD family two-component response regulator
MNAVLRGSDLKCRYGGEEFLICFPIRRRRAASVSRKHCDAKSRRARFRGTTRCCA